MEYTCATKLLKCTSLDPFMQTYDVFNSTHTCTQGAPAHLLLHAPAQPPPSPGPLPVLCAPTLPALLVRQWGWHVHRAPRAAAAVTACCAQRGCWLGAADKQQKKREGGTSGQDCKKEGAERAWQECAQRVISQHKGHTHLSMQCVSGQHRLRARCSAAYVHTKSTPYPPHEVKQRLHACLKGDARCQQHEALIPADLGGSKQEAWTCKALADFLSTMQKVSVASNMLTREQT
eukprot:1161702-Pelagomonas_calceolata.AAC.14